MADLVGRGDVERPLPLPLPSATHARPADDDHDQTREALKTRAAKKLALKLQQAKRSDSEHLQSRLDQHQAGLEQAWGKLVGGSRGAEVASAALGWAEATPLQRKLTDAQRNLFKQRMVAQPEATAPAARALSRLAAEPGFGRAVVQSQHAGDLQGHLLARPGLEPAARSVIRSGFMQAPAADGQAKGSFLGFGLRRMGASPAAGPALQAAGDMLGSLATSRVNAAGQRAALAMVERRPDHVDAMQRLDAFATSPVALGLPSFARGAATSILARSNGASEVRDNLEGIVSQPAFAAQDLGAKEKLLGTLNLGASKHLGALTANTLAVLRHPGFPQQPRQVGRFLDQLRTRVLAKGGARVDVAAAMHESQAPRIPSPPVLLPTDRGDPDDIDRARRHNRSQVLQYYAKLNRLYDGAAKTYQAARYFEDISLLEPLPTPGVLDLSHQGADERHLFGGLGTSAEGRFASLRTLRGERLQELRLSRAPARRRRRGGARLQGPQPRYFTPGALAGRGREAVAALPTTRAASAPAGGAGLTPAALSAPSAGASAMPARAPAGDVATLLASIPAHLPVAEQLQQARAQLARLVNQQMNAVAQHFLAGGAAARGPEPLEERTPPPPRPPAPGEAREARPGRASAPATDGWGIPRAVARELEAPQAPVVRPAQSGLSEAEGGDPDIGGRRLMSAGAEVRATEILLGLPWKAINRAEAALLRNLGWNQALWDGRSDAGAAWPRAMRTRFSSLSAGQRASVRRLGLDEQGWDDFVGRLERG